MPQLWAVLPPRHLSETATPLLRPRPYARQQVTPQPAGYFKKRKQGTTDAYEHTHTQHSDRYQIWGGGGGPLLQGGHMEIESEERSARLCGKQVPPAYRELGERERGGVNGLSASRAGLVSQNKCLIPMSTINAIEMLNMALLEKERSRSAF